ncbi:YitT family protein [Neofamilia massiliensis]|uniref:YitT family protein n=1 Tax=Neofamilia massiliensis TaxID=1673724 RepID=UPI0006BB53EA|nr:YitT family protein [Neofamilia massiliensis]
MLNQKLTWFKLTRAGLINIILGSMIMAFTVVNIHIPSQITEGGILGLALLAYKTFGINPSILSPIMDIICIIIGINIFGKIFLRRTMVASLLFAFSYKIFALMGPILPNLYSYPLLAAVVGGIGIGLGCGLVVSQGGASGGDDALALVISNKAKINISYAYLLMDVIVLLMSLTYIPFGRLIFSLITTTVSSVLVGQFEIKVSSPVEETNLTI